MAENENAALRFVDYHRDGSRANHIAFREAAGEKRSITYAELAETTDRVANAFGKEGINREERVVMLVLDQVEFPQIFWGALKAGVVPIPLNTLLATDVYQAILEDSRATCLFVSHELAEIVLPATLGNPYLKKIVMIGGQQAKNTISFDTFMHGAVAQTAISVSADENAFWLYSSGSTGQPKGVRHVHGALAATAETYGAKVLQIQPDDVVYSVAKLFFAYGLGNSMTFPMSVGATAVLFNGRPTPETVTNIIAEEQPTIFCGVPTLYAALVHYFEENKNVPTAPVRRCISAGEALPEEIGKKWKSLMGVDIFDGVGSTEMLHIFLSNGPDDVIYGTSGTAVPGYKIRIVDENNNDVQTGGIGELLVKGDSSADNYWNNRQKSRTTFEGEWTRTGDKYEIRGDGRLIYCGRTDDMFKVSGIWVSPFEIEQALVSHPMVLEAAVVAKTDDEGLEKPQAFVVLKSPEDANKVGDLKEYIKERIGKWKYPRWIEVVEDLPKTATGKIQRFKLRG